MTTSHGVHTDITNLSPPYLYVLPIGVRLFSTYIAMPDVISICLIIIYML